MIVREVPHDSALPQLVTVLDGEAMRAIFQAALLDFTAGAQQFPRDTTGRCRSIALESCTIERIKYKPEKNCLICYHLQLRDLLTGNRDEQRLCARVYPPGASASRFRKAQSQPLVTPTVGPPLWHLPALGMVAWAFPNDRKLTRLHRLINPVSLRSMLLPIIAQHFGYEWQLVDLTPALVHYAPEYTCTIRVQLHLQHYQTGDRQTVVLFGKLYESDQGAETDRLMQQLWASPARVDGCLTIAQTLGYDAAQKILWQWGLPGITLQETSLDRPLFYCYLRRAAQAVAALHQEPMQPVRLAGVQDRVAKLQEMHQLLSRVFPAGEAPAAALVGRLVRQAEQLPPQPVALLHGDLHLKNFLLDGEQVALIDLDDLRQGSPWQDVGSFLAALHYRGLIEGLPLTETERTGAIFCNAYERNAPWPADRSSLAWFTAVALINERALRTITRLQGGGMAMLEALLIQAAQISDAMMHDTL